MAGFEMCSWIDRAPTEVFDFAVDPGNAPRVMDSVVSCESVTAEPLGVGSKLRETREMKGERHTTELEVVRFDRPRRFGVRNETKGVEVVYEYLFEPSRGGTEILLECRLAASGFRRFLLPVVAKVLQKEDGEHLERLKRAIEGS